MKHWFIRFLESNGQDNLERAQRYREAIKGETEKARSLREAFDEGEEGDKEMLWEADRFEQEGHRYLEWARLAEDMIECGMEEQALRYYYARRSTEKDRLIAPITREDWDFTYNSEMMREEMGTTTSSEKQEVLSRILSAFSGLYTVGLPNQIIDYYQSKRVQCPELNLPEPIIHEEFDEEERATGRMKNMKHWFIEWLTDQSIAATEEQAGQYRYWILIAQDLIELGMEQTALNYYDARREEQGLLPRPDQVAEWNLEEVLPILEKRIRSATDSAELRILSNVYTSICELLDVDMRSVAISLYLRHLRKHLELNLPDLKVSVRSEP